MNATDTTTTRFCDGCEDLTTTTQVQVEGTTYHLCDMCA